jgi:hypothetical protein
LFAGRASGLRGEGFKAVDPEVVEAMMEAVVENRRLLVGKACHEAHPMHPL